MGGAGFNLPPHLQGVRRMGRIMRIALAENVPQALALEMSTAGKLLIRND